MSENKRRRFGQELEQEQEQMQQPGGSYLAQIEEESTRQQEQMQMQNPIPWRAPPPRRNWQPNLNTLAFQARVEDVGLERRLINLAIALKAYMLADENARYIGEQPFDQRIPAYMRPMKFKVTMPEEPPVAVILLKEPTVPKQSQAVLDLFRETGLSAIMESVTVNEKTELVNPSIRFLFEMMPQYEGMAKGVVEKKSIVLDRFPFFLPYGYKLVEFLKHLSNSATHGYLFIELNECVNQLFQLIVEFCETKKVEIPIFTFGKMAENSTKPGEFLFLENTASRCFTARIPNWHPAVFVDLRKKPQTNEQFLHIQQGYDKLLSAIAGRPISGRFCADFQFRHPSLIGKLNFCTHTFTAEECKYLAHFCFPCISDNAMAVSAFWLCVPTHVVFFLLFFSVSAHTHTHTHTGTAGGKYVCVHLYMYWWYAMAVSMNTLTLVMLPLAFAILHMHAYTHTLHSTHR